MIRYICETQMSVTIENVNTRTVSCLKSYLKGNNIVGYSKWKKEELIKIAIQILMGTYVPVRKVYNRNLYFDQVPYSSLINYMLKFNKNNRSLMEWDSKNRLSSYPEAFTEELFCKVMYSITGQTYRRLYKDRHGVYTSSDIYCEETGKYIQLKSSTVGFKGNVKPGVSSFGPNSKWDQLYYMYINSDTLNIKVYMVHGDLKNIMCNKTNKTTFGDQQKSGRRPRFDLYSYCSENATQMADVTITIISKKQFGLVDNTTDKQMIPYN